MNRRPRVFLSYTQKDRPQVRRIYRRLRWRGYEPFMDQQMLGGIDWEKNLEREIREADSVVVCWTQNSSASTYMPKEIELANKLVADQLKPRNFIVPLRLDTSGLPDSLSDRQAISLQDDWKKFLKSLPPAPPAVWPYIAALAALMVLMLTLWWRHLPEPDKFRWTRVAPGWIARLTAPRVGVTFWEMRLSIPSDPERVRFSAKNLGESTDAEYTAVRGDAETVFRMGSRIRLGLETTRPGFLYIIGQEDHKQSKPGALRLIYPTAKTLGRGNFISPGVLVGLPDDRALIQSWVTEHKEPDYAGETLTIVVFPQKMTALDQLAAAGVQPVLEGELAARITGLRETWGSRAEKAFSSAGGAIESVGEAEARRGARELGVLDPPPRTGYKASAGIHDPVVVTIPITILP